MHKSLKVFIKLLYFIGLAISLIAVIKPLWLYIAYDNIVGFTDEENFYNVYHKVQFIAGISPYFVLSFPFLAKKYLIKILESKPKIKAAFEKVMKWYTGVIACFGIAAYLVTADIQEMFMWLKLPDYLVYDFLLSIQNIKMLIGALVILFFVLISFNKFINYFRSRINQPVAEKLLENDTRKPVLLLRPFKFDKARMPPVKLGKVGNFIEIENLLAYVLSSTGPVVAIGKPGERIQPLGASRLYVKESSNWQEEVHKLLEDSSIVIMFLDYSPGVKWEIMQTVQRYREKVLFIPKLYAFRLNWFVFIFDKIPNLGLLCTDGLKNFLFKHRKRFLKYRRGLKWYRQWKLLHSEMEILPDINDKVSCFLINNKDEAVIFESKDTTLAEQVNAILEAIRYRAKELASNRDEAKE